MNLVVGDARVKVHHKNNIGGACENEGPKVYLTRF